MKWLFVRRLVLGSALVDMVGTPFDDTVCLLRNVSVGRRRSLFMALLFRRFPTRAHSSMERRWDFTHFFKLRCCVFICLFLLHSQRYLRAQIFLCRGHAPRKGRRRIPCSIIEATYGFLF